tara:strand:- start:3219 stop:4484 length:1266 start_codon:yes stop_codon:yes gene_type:complete
MAKPKTSEELPIQPVLNIGIVGHVDHGKTTLLEKLSGKWTDTHSEELKRGITIRLGYADVIFKKCEKCPEPTYTTLEKCPKCSNPPTPLRKVSFVDAPGHESLMATMLAGATIMDAALILVAANETCPQPQTREHIMALDITGIKNVIVIQNKIDLVNEEQAIKNQKEIKEFLKDTPFKNSPIIPLSAQHSAGISTLIKTIEEYFPTPERDSTKKSVMLIARSFDINKPGMDISKMVGGVLGGSLTQGTLKKGDEIEISPGRKTTSKNKDTWIPIKTFVTSINSGGQDIEEAHPGGSIGVLTSLDPSVVKSDQLTGAVVSQPGKSPPTWYGLTFKTHLLKRVVGTLKELNVSPIKLNEPLMLNVNSAATVGIVVELKKDIVRCKLKIPICAEVNSRVTISRNIGNRFRLIGYGEISKGKKD